MKFLYFYTKTPKKKQEEVVQEVIFLVDFSSDQMMARTYLPMGRLIVSPTDC